MTTFLYTKYLETCVLTAALLLFGLLPANANTSLQFTRHQVGTDTQYESCTVADFNKDGKMDIVSGSTLYTGPEWNPQDIGIPWNGFDDFDVPVDMDGDGRMDVVRGGYGMGLHWFRNVEGGTWTGVKIADGHPHCGELWDIDGDGKRLELLAGGEGPTFWYALEKNNQGLPEWKKYTVSDKKMNWGYGAGDINGDGRTDIIRPDAWYEAPANPRTGEWKEHCLALGYLTDANPRFISPCPCGKTDHTQLIWVGDINGDNLNDIMASAAHSYGVFWYEQTRSGNGGISFKQHIIDSSWAQAHSLHMADLDNDGDPDLVAGKRVGYGGDVNYIPEHPPRLYWYELNTDSAGLWVRHTLAFDEAIGAGTHIAIEDMDGDGDLDIVATSKAGGPWLFENKGGPVPVKPRNPQALRFVPVPGPRLFYEGNRIYTTTDSNEKRYLNGTLSVK